MISTERGNSAGLAVTRTGQRSARVALPRGPIGALLDEDHLAGQIRHMLDTLGALALPHTDLVVPAVGFEPAMMISIGKVDGPPSNTASFGMGMPPHVRPASDDAVAFTTIATNTEQVTAELAARLVAGHRMAARLV